MLTFKNGKENFGRTSTKESVEILFAGDFYPGKPESQKLILDGKSGDILAGVKDHLEDCDISVIQFETPLTDKGENIPKSGPNLKSPPGCVDFVKKGDFDVALLANNHIGDVGTKAVLETLRILDRNGIKTVGAGKDIEDASKPLVIRKNGINMAIMNIAENEFGGADFDKPGSNPLNVPRNISQIVELSRKFDLVIVIVHGGNEHNPFPSPRMVDTYRAFADAGAAAVVSIHTHCPEGIEIWNGKPIVYSLGNFYFTYPGKNYSPTDFWWKGYMLKMKFDKKKAYALEVILTAFGPDEGKIIPLAGKTKEKFLSYLRSISAPLGNRRELRRILDACSAHKAYANIEFIKSYCISGWPAGNEPEKVEAFLADSENFRHLMVLRNLVNCETHHEILANRLRLFEDRKVKEAEKDIVRYSKFKNADFGF